MRFRCTYRRCGVCPRQHPTEHCMEKVADGEAVQLYVPATQGIIILESGLSTEASNEAPMRARFHETAVHPCFTLSNLGLGRTAPVASCGPPKCTRLPTSPDERNADESSRNLLPANCGLAARQPNSSRLPDEWSGKSYSGVQQERVERTPTLIFSGEFGRQYGEGPRTNTPDDHISRGKRNWFEFFETTGQILNQ